MFFLHVLFTGFVLSMDSFSAAVAMGSRPFTKRQAFGFSFSSGLAEAFLALLGALAGSKMIRYFGSVDHWIAFGLLMAVAVHMAYEGIRDCLEKKPQREKTSFHSLTKIFVVSLATSFDAFGVGIGLGIAGKLLWPYIFSIGFWAVTMSVCGLYLSKRLSRTFGPAMNIVGAFILSILAVQMLKI